MHVIGQKRLAELFNVTERSICSYMAQGMPHTKPNKAGQPVIYELDQALIWAKTHKKRILYTGQQSPSMI